MRSRNTPFTSAIDDETQPLFRGEISSPAETNVTGALDREQEKVSVADITRLYAFDRDDVTTMKEAVQVKALPESWREYFRRRLVARAA